MSSRKPPPSGTQTGFDFGRTKEAPPAELFDRPIDHAAADEPPRAPSVTPPVGQPADATPPSTSTPMWARPEPKPPWLPNAGATPGSTPGPVPGETGPRVYRVDELVRLANRTLEAKFGFVWVEGEVSNLSRPSSGHLYFTLKDHGAQLPCVMFRTAAQRLKFTVQDGQALRVRGKLGIFDQAGKLQLYAEELEPVGLGALQLAFEQLRKKLEDEGLFARGRKRPLPAWPRTVGIVTSSTGAVVRDIIRVAERRGRVRLLLAPCQVQGPSAVPEILAALRLIQTQPGVDVVILGRGGGSAEDLAAFNDERVARAIAACRVPVVSAVGHEVDFTIADFVADVRAPTPSAAAELVVPLFAAAQEAHERDVLRLSRAMTRRLGDTRQRLDATLDRGTVAWQRLVAKRRQELAAYGKRLHQKHPAEQLRAQRAALRAVVQRLFEVNPGRGLRVRREMVKNLYQRLQQATQRRVTTSRRDFADLVGRLSALSPLAVLERGYAVAVTPTGHVVTSVAEVAPGDALSVRVADGQIEVEVKSAKRSE